MNDLWLLVAGLAIAGLPLLCMLLLVVATGHAIKGGLQSAFFWLVHLGYISIPVSVPAGLVLAAIAIIRMLMPG